MAYFFYCKAVVLIKLESQLRISYLVMMLVSKVESEKRLSRFSFVNRAATSFHNSNLKNSPVTPIDLDNDEIYGFLKSLKEKNVIYILVGGFAIAFHGLIRATYDMDLWIKDDPRNLENFKKVLIDFGVKGLEEARSFDMIPGFTTFSLGESGFVIDPMKSLKAFKNFEFDACYTRAEEGTYKGVTFKVISRTDLLKEKETINRPKDQQDIEHLKNLLEE